MSHHEGRGPGDHADVLLHVQLRRGSVQNTTPEQDTPKPVDDTTPVFRNIQIKDLQAITKRGAGHRLGLPESQIANVVLKT